VIGGWLTTDFSWRWGFRVNVVVAPLAALAALVSLPADLRRQGRARIDGRGAALLAVGLFLLVFALTEAPDHGWLANEGGGLTLGAVTVWPSSWWLSPVPAALAGAAIGLTAFTSAERTSRDPLVDLWLFARRSFRGGLVTAATVVMAQAGAMFVLAVFLQSTHHLSAVSTGRWLLPVGVAALIGAQTGGRVATRTGPTTVVRIGIFVELAGVLVAAAVLRSGVDWAPLAATLAAFGFGAGMASSQLTNVILSEVPLDRAGSASGVSTTNNALAAALGVAILGAVLRVGALDAGAGRWALVAAALLLAAGAVASFRIPAIGAAPPSPPRPADGEPNRHQAARILEGAGHGAA
jgi:predicted MFS family arabinose efflux permease